MSNLLWLPVWLLFARRTSWPTQFLHRYSPCIEQLKTAVLTVSATAAGADDVERCAVLFLGLAAHALR